MTTIAGIIDTFRGTYLLMRGSDQSRFTSLKMAARNALAATFK